MLLPHPLFSALCCRGSRLRGASPNRRSRWSVDPPGMTEGVHGVHALQQVKGRVHRKLLERLNLSNLDRLDRQQVADAVVRSSRT